VQHAYLTPVSAHRKCNLLEIQCYTYNQRSSYNCTNLVPTPQLHYPHRTNSAEQDADFRTGQPRAFPALQKVIRMHTARFVIPSLRDARSADDLVSALVSVSGVSDLHVDAITQTLSVEYDPDYLDARSLGFFITSVGYPVAAAQGESGTEPVPAGG
jgi:hypothetical protein